MEPGWGSWSDAGGNQEQEDSSSASDDLAAVVEWPTEDQQLHHAPWVSMPSSSEEEESAAAAREAQMPLPDMQQSQSAGPTSASGRRAAAAVHPDSPPKKQRHYYGENVLTADQVEALMDQEFEPRPTVLDLAATRQIESGGWVFKETGKKIRPPDAQADKWRRSGGVGGATDLPSSQEPRVRRRFGYVVQSAPQSPRLRYHQYCRLIPASTKLLGQSCEDSGGVEEDSQTWLFHVLPPPEPSHVVPLPSQHHVASRRLPQTTKIDGTLLVVADKYDPLVRLSATPREAGQATDFIHFEEAGREVGKICHSDRGLQLRSAAGDFAEWHPALDLAELPYVEGSVVGLFGGKISLRTAGANMVAVVSRRALCVGSYPGTDKAAEGDVIAYLGQVPVRVRGHVASGDRLVPSMRNDGTAVAWKHDTNAVQDSHATTVGIAMSGHVPGGQDDRKDGSDADVGLVDALITPPSAQRTRHREQSPTHGFMGMAHRSSVRRRGAVLRSSMALLVATMGLALALRYVGLVDSSRCNGRGCNAGSVHPSAPAVDQDPCTDVSCGPGHCTSVRNGSATAGPFHQAGAERSLPTGGTAGAWCNCPEGFSSRTASNITGDGTATPSCEPNVCTTVHSSLVDPAASHTVRWAGGFEYQDGAQVAACNQLRTFERCQYTCDPGYVPVGDALCLPNGSLVGGDCVPVGCKPLAIPHSDRSHGNECTGSTGDGCNFTCAKGYRRAQAQIGPQPEGMGPLLCQAPTQEFESDFAFTVSGAIDAAYNGVYAMTNRSCNNRAVWQRRRLQGSNTTDDGAVLYAAQSSISGTIWLLGPTQRAVDCKSLNKYVHAYNSYSRCSDALGPRFGGTTMQLTPDNVACNPPVSYWAETLHSCEGVGDVTCRCRDEGMPEASCWIYNKKLRVERSAASTGGASGQRQLCVPMAG